MQCLPQSILPFLVKGPERLKIVRVGLVELVEHSYDLLSLAFSPGGYYQSYLASQCPGSEALTVEKNPTIVEAARDYFGFEGQFSVFFFTCVPLHVGFV